MRASLIQMGMDPDESVESRRVRAASLVRDQSDVDLVVLPELWNLGAFAYDSFATGAEPLDGPTGRAMAEAARDAGVWLQAGSLVERAPDGTLYNTATLYSPDGALARSYRKIHRFGFDTGEAVLMGAGQDVVTAPLPAATLGLATCYDIRFPELFRHLVDAGAQLLAIPAGWPARRREHWRLLTRARAVENQAYVLGCCAAGTSGGVVHAGHSVVVDPWGEVLAEAGKDEEVLSVEIDPSRVARARADFPVLRDRVLGLAELVRFGHFSGDGAYLGDEVDERPAVVKLCSSAFEAVPHTIRDAPEGGITAQLFCMIQGCGESSGPRGDPDEAQDWALRHTGRTGHDLFRREYTDHARVTRDE